MPSWTHLIRFIACEDHQPHLGQLVDTRADVGLESLKTERNIKAYLIRGTIFDGQVTQIILTVKDEANLALPKAPILFTKPRSALIGPYPAAINIAKCAQDGTSDYEAELCLVIGKTGRDIPEDDALDYVLGYTASNDVSARTLQMITPQWSMSKGLDSSCPIGPVLVAPSVIEDPQSLNISALYNGAVVQDGHTSNMIFNIRKQISYLSQGTTLEAGSLLLTGTPAGIGYFRDPRVVLKDGDDIRVYVEKIGTLVNRVRYE